MMKRKMKMIESNTIYKEVTKKTRGQQATIARLTEISMKEDIKKLNSTIIGMMKKKMEMVVGNTICKEVTKGTRGQQAARARLTEISMKVDVKEMAIFRKKTNGVIIHPT